jgi:hypothetical protein
MPEVIGWILILLYLGLLAVFVSVISRQRKHIASLQKKLDSYSEVREKLSDCIKGRLKRAEANAYLQGRNQDYHIALADHYEKQLRERNQEVHAANRRVRELELDIEYMKEQRRNST